MKNFKAIRKMFWESNPQFSQGETGKLVEDAFTDFVDNLLHTGIINDATNWHITLY